MPPIQNGPSHEVGLALLRELAKGGDSRVLISPHGLTSALLLAWNGTAGKTRQVITGVLGMPPGIGKERVNSSWAALDRSLLSADAGVQLAISNSLWCRDGTELLAEFLARGRDGFGAQLRNVDFAAPGAAGVINRWVKESTGGKINTIVPDPIPAEVRLYVINAICFKGQWSAKFDIADTQPGD